MKKLLRYIALIALLLHLFACSTQKNTATTRWWKSFNSRYNTYFNGHQSYINGMKSKEEGIKDNYTEYLPLLMVGNKSAQNIGKSDFDNAILKCEKTIKLHSIKTKPELKRNHRLSAREKEFRERQEFNPFLKNAWILMGKAQLQSGNFLEAASTFAYTERLYKNQPEVANEARALLALCYTELEWYYDADVIFRKIRRDSIDYSVRRDYNTSLADFYLRQKKWKEALPYLQNEVKALPHGVLKARGAFLLGQVCTTLEMKQEAYKAFQKCMRQSPPYELRFNAQILQTEVMPQGNNRKKLAKLNRLARNVNNKNYLDQVYYAIGNVYMAMPDTVKAIKAYETGGKKSTTSGPAKGLLMLTLGDIYWQQERFGEAQRCYSAALGIISKENERYEQLNFRTKVLDQLAPFTNEVHLQDSLQALVRMPEKERLAAIDLIIEAVKQKQKAARRAQADSIANAQRNGGNTGNRMNNTVNNKQENTTTQNAGEWYFYNQQSVTQGQEFFRKQWGNRKNEDNWRRANKTVLQSDNGKGVDYAKEDSIDAAKSKAGADSTKTDSLDKKKKDKVENDSISKDPLSRSYYLAQLPFTEDQMKASNDKLKDALYHAGVIEQEQLENYPLARKTLMRVLLEHSDFQPMDELLYHLFLLHLRWSTREEAETYRQKLKDGFPDSKYTALITDPEFELKAKYGEHIEDSLYTAAYNAYRVNDINTMVQNCAISKQKYPNGANRAKFMFLDAMTLLRKNDVKGFTEELRDLVKTYPSDKISEIAGMMVKNIDAGRVPGKGGYSMSDLWNSRNNASTAAADSVLRKDSLTAERNTDFVFILAYPTDSVDEGKLLYDVSRFNFTSFMVRNFDIQLTKTGALSQLQVNGFLSFDEVHRYVQELYRDSAFQTVLQHTRPVLISKKNLQLIGIKYSLNDYAKFYEKNFVPSKVKEDLKLDTQPGNFIWDEFQEVKEKDKEENTDQKEDDSGEWY